jgi:hypothetical protein
VPIQRPNAHAAWRSVTSDSAVRVASRVSEMSLTLVESTRFRTAGISYAPAHLFRASAMCHQRTWLAATLQIRRAFGPSLKEYAIRATCGHAYASLGVRTAGPAVGHCCDRGPHAQPRNPSHSVTRDGTVLGMVSMRDLLAFEMWVA